MTERRRFLNKINERVRSIANRTGASKEDILSKIDSIDGAYVTDSNNVNIDPRFFNEETMKQIEEAIPTYIGAREQALTPYKDFVGPLSEKQINAEIKEMFAFEDDIDEVVKEFYELDASLLPWQKATQDFKDISEQLTELGKQWHDEVPYSELSNVLSKIKDLKGWS